jgi:adhesin transport system outer membrane protein
MRPPAFLSAALAALSLATPAAASTFTARGYVAAVMKASPALGAARETWEQAEAAYRGALFDAGLPSLTLSLNNDLYTDEDPHWRLQRRDMTSSLAARWNLYDSSNSPLAKLRKARLAHETARLAWRTAQQELALKALARYYALYGARRRVETAKANLASRERQLTDTKEQFDSGTRSRIELTQSEGDKLQSEVSLASARTAERKARVSFNELLDADPGAEQGLEVSTAAAAALRPESADLERALRDNYALRSARVALERTRLDARLGVMGSLPTLRVDAAWTKTGLGLAGEPGRRGTNNPDYGVGASLSWPVGFLGAQNAFNSAARRAAARSGTLGLAETERAFKASFLLARADIELQAESLRLLEFQVKAQKEATEELLKEYALGGAQFLQLDTAQTKLLDSSNQLIDALNALELARAGYRALLGEAFWEE